MTSLQVDTNKLENIAYKLILCNCALLVKDIAIYVFQSPCEITFGIPRNS